jgi:hypothetical protein
MGRAKVEVDDTAAFSIYRESTKLAEAKLLRMIFVQITPWNASRAWERLNRLPKRARIPLVESFTGFQE